MLTSTGRAGLALALAAAVVTGSRAPQSAQSLGAADPAGALGAVLELALLGVSVWFLTAVTLTAAPGTLGRCGRALVPTAVRTTVFVGVVGAGFSGVAHAESTDWPVEGLRLPERALVDPVPASESAPEAAPTAPAPSTGRSASRPEPPARPGPDHPLPRDAAREDRTGSTRSPAAEPPGRAAPPARAARDAPRHRAEAPAVPGAEDGTGPGPASTRPAAAHVVKPGDTLWALAAASLPPAASPQEVQRRVEEIHRTNRVVIGSDPDLIRPGQHISLPTTDGAPR